MNESFETPKRHIAERALNFGDGDAVLTIL